MCRNVLSVSFSEAPEGYARRQVATVIHIFANQFPKSFESLPAHRHVIVRAAGVADLIPHLVEAVGLLQGHAQLPSVY
jgi:hypothetical protein